LINNSGARKAEKPTSRGNSLTAAVIFTSLLRLASLTEESNKEPEKRDLININHDKF
jgi:hypothetical protein